MALHHGTESSHSTVYTTINVNTDYWTDTDRPAIIISRSAELAISRRNDCTPLASTNQRISNYYKMRRFKLTLCLQTGLSEWVRCKIMLKVAKTLIRPFQSTFWSTRCICSSSEWIMALRNTESSVVVKTIPRVGKTTTIRFYKNYSRTAIFQIVFYTIQLVYFSYN